MLTLTETATTVVKSIVAQNADAAVEGGLRIGSSADGKADLTVTVVPAAQPGDSLVESEGARVYLESTAVPALEDKVLDAKVDDDGSIRFAIGTQA